MEPVLPPKLEAGRDSIIAISDRISGTQDKKKVVVEGFRAELKFGLVEVVYEWAKGMVRVPFVLFWSDNQWTSAAV